MKKLLNFIAWTTTVLYSILCFIVGIVLGLYITVRVFFDKQTRQMIFTADKKQIEQAFDKAMTKYGPC